MTFNAMRRVAAWSLLLAVILLAGCASGPFRGSGAAGSNLPAGVWPDRDGPEPKPPSNLERVPDAQPQLEAIRENGPNKPYAVLGRSYVPITRDEPFSESGLASWYGRFFHGKRTASGEVYNMYAMTAAHPTLPIPSYVRVRNPVNGREVIVRINDRGPFHGGRIIDLSYTAAVKLDLRGVGKVEVQRITFEDIRTGSWKQNGVTAGDAVAAAGPAASAPGGAAAVSVDAPVLVAASTADVSTASASGTAPAPLAAPAPAAAPASVPSPAPAAVPASIPAPAAAAVATVTAEPRAPSSLPAAPVADAPPDRAYTAASRGFWVQLGAFRQREGAVGFQQRVESQIDWIAPMLALFNDSNLYRLQVGPFASRDEARVAAERIRAGLQLVPMLVEKR